MLSIKLVLFLAFALCLISYAFVEGIELDLEGKSLDELTTLLNELRRGQEQLMEQWAKWDPYKKSKKIKGQQRAWVEMSMGGMELRIADVDKMIEEVEDKMVELAE